MRKAALHNLGCKVNAYETEAMQQLLEEAGYEIVPFQEKADVYVINTCSVTNIADRKSRQMLHRAKKMNPDAVVVAAGCYVQAAGEELKKDAAIDVIIGNNRKKDLVPLLDEYFAGKHVEEDSLIDIGKTREYEALHINKIADHTRAFIKIQDGCNQFCSYCIIPYTRGRVRSRKPEEIMEEIKGLVDRGYQEVVLTGIHLSSYGLDLDGITLLDLMVKIDKIQGLERLRLGSLEPRIVTEEFTRTLAGLRTICPHFHLSLQSGCDATLKRMNRRYTTEEYEKGCQILRKYFDRPAITTDVIVGFPQETEEEFAQTVEFLKRIHFYEMHVFKYSKRSGTIAATMEQQVSDAVKEKRSNVLLELTANQKAAFEAQFSGELLPVLMEEYDCIDKDGKPAYVMKGHTDRYILVKQETTREVCEQSVNTFVDILYRPEKSK